MGILNGSDALYLQELIVCSRAKGAFITLLCIPEFITKTRRRQKYHRASTAANSTHQRLSTTAQG